MAPVIIGMGTIVNVATVVVGSLLGILLGNRIREHTKETITSVLGLFTMVLGGMSVVAMNSEALGTVVGKAAMIVVLAALLIGAVIGTTLRIEDRLEQGATWLRGRFSGAGDAARFVDGFVTSTLVFCVGPLAVLGSFSDGLGRGAEQLYIKAILDGFAAMAFASTLGWGVLASAGRWPSSRARSPRSATSPATCCLRPRSTRSPPPAASSSWGSASGC
ncbi:DUF554 domain-containing protein [Tessaracoccus coleopterorum]|uniref:DUF554 domain-containing protein n=1 Tax=Tessaracoccus coleopterorum TaxID=2714950 RepID=UPI0022B2381F|nr:DUF554 domain-containing protein [Tessaracoccus coleopterorum]